MKLYKFTERSIKIMSLHLSENKVVVNWEENKTKT